MANRIYYIKTIGFLIGLLINSYLQGQGFIEVIEDSGFIYQNEVKKITTDNFDNIYTLGKQSETVSADPFFLEKKDGDLNTLWKIELEILTPGYPESYFLDMLTAPNGISFVLTRKTGPVYLPGGYYNRDTCYLLAFSPTGELLLQNIVNDTSRVISILDEVGSLALDQIGNPIVMLHSFDMDAIGEYHVFDSLVVTKYKATTGEVKKKIKEDIVFSTEYPFVFSECDSKGNLYLFSINPVTGNTFSRYNSNLIKTWEKNLSTYVPASIQLFKNKAIYFFDNGGNGLPWDYVKVTKIKSIDADTIFTTEVLAPTYISTTSILYSETALDPVGNPIIFYSQKNGAPTLTYLLKLRNSDGEVLFHNNVAYTEFDHYYFDMLAGSTGDIFLLGAYNSGLNVPSVRKYNFFGDSVWLHIAEESEFDKKINYFGNLITASNKIVSADIIELPGFNFGRYTVAFDGNLEFKLGNESILEEQVQSTAVSATIYPNPASDKISLVVTTGEEIQSIRSYDYTGKEINLSFNSTLDAEVQNLKPGIYLTIITTSYGQHSLSWIKY